MILAGSCLAVSARGTGLCDRDTVVESLCDSGLIPFSPLPQWNSAFVGYPDLLNVPRIGETGSDCDNAIICGDYQFPGLTGYREIDTKNGYAPNEYLRTHSSFHWSPSAFANSDASQLTFTRIRYETSKGGMTEIDVSLVREGSTKLQISSTQPQLFWQGEVPPGLIRIGGGFSRDGAQYFYVIAGADLDLTKGRVLVMSLTPPPISELAHASIDGVQLFSLSGLRPASYQFGNIYSSFGVLGSNPGGGLVPIAEFPDFKLSVEAVPYTQ